MDIEATLRNSSIAGTAQKGGAKLALKVFI